MQRREGRREGEGNEGIFPLFLALVALAVGSVMLPTKNICEPQLQKQLSPGESNTTWRQGSINKMQCSNGYL